MNPEKAIEILEQHRLSYSPSLNPRLAEAHQLGIEALERHNQRHHTTFSGMMLPLTCETPPADSHDILPPTRFGILIGYARRLINPSYQEGS